MSDKLMLEKDMEELIARYSQEFFPRKKLILMDRQRNFPGVGRFDLMFLDEYNTNILMELKARTAKYEDASQLAKYLDAMNALGEKNILMWLVAPQIPNSVREFLDRIGIEYTEIHISEYKRIANKYDYNFQSEITKESNQIVPRQISSPKINNNKSRESFRSNYNSIIQSKYRATRDNLNHTFENGYDFLCQVERNDNDIWLGTAKNAHLYLRNNYLAYIVLESDNLIFRGRFNNQIYSGTIDKSKSMFSENFRNLILNLDGFKNGWAIQSGEKFIFRNNTPKAFFKDLFDYISKLKLE